MTNKEFFIETISAEQPTFMKVLKAFPKDKLDWKPAEKGRTAGRVLFQLASQPHFMSAIAMSGKPDWGTYKEPENPDLDSMAALMDKNFTQLKKDLASVSDADWENATALMEWPGGKWEVKRFEMAWGFLFDAIHHRGQLTTYLRAMGGKVPSIYGGSSDEPVS
jgi:uncharacterized damage-inducible protein DinB